MKVLIVFREGKSENLFVSTLLQGIRNEGIDIDCSLDKFWNSDTHYDIIHFQWPEEVVGWSGVNDEILDKLRNRVLFYKQRNTKFIYTRHNTRSHYNDKYINEAYSIVESACDLVVHMGKYSLNEYKSKNPDSKNIVIPHHIYEGAYNTNISINEARKKLHLPPNKYIIIAFGKFRNNTERAMTLKMFFNVKVKNKLLLVPRFFPFQKHPNHRNPIKSLISWLSYYLIIPIFRLFNIYGGGHNEIIDDEDLPYYISASDIVFIQRKHILNSGNIPLAFLFRKVPVGPDVGNVGEILHETGNPTFNPDDINSISDAILQGDKLCKQHHGDDNYEYASRYMSIKHIAGSYTKAYESLITIK